MKEHDDDGVVGSVSNPGDGRVFRATNVSVEGCAKQMRSVRCIG